LKNLPCSLVDFSGFSSIILLLDCPFGKHFSQEGIFVPGKIRNKNTDTE